ncbi:MAG: penicillin-binding protein [Hydrogenophilales bacterium 16-64-46]|nr:MAG: penicillin-binding protein [Hydrogenophilales bacterium 12-64-13]OYZ06562.1 MAG: penicillin-binding protein [Hydrogenophilales bacterium 16-64-46]OZA39270.1 MAG: penicillin-binding protein [Hydrogenophilales bacterium 17-64-34]HQS98824.1 penicillin-binding protein 1A [Thiobacillus sp.]
MFSKWWHYALALAVSLGVVGTALAGLAAALIYPNLPPLEALTDYKPKLPLRVYTADGALIGEFGEERRAFIAIDKVPAYMKQAIIAAEDERFYTHGGVDTLGILRAASANLLSGGVKEGASTITMQVARNFFLSNEKTFTRKLSEAMLAMKIEHNLSKDKILELYINQIYLGQRAYGFEAAARTYFGKPMQDLSLAEFAMLAGLPKAPSRYNPVVNFPRAKARQEYVLKRMLTLRFIDQPTWQAAMAQKLVIRQTRQQTDVVADFAAEMVRQTLFEKYGESIYSSGYKAVTTLLRAQQAAANQAVWLGVADYDLRHGYRGPEKQIALPDDKATRESMIADTLSELSPVSDMQPAVVVSATPRLIRAQLQAGSVVEITGNSLKWVADWIAGKKGRQLLPGAVVRVQATSAKAWRLAQLPEVEAALVAVSPKNGAITALVGGFDFNRNKFNHVTQAWRQPGSSFKPFIYSAALEKGYTPATMVDNAPITLAAEEAGGTAWEPKNYDGSTGGPVRLRSALTKSLNLVSVRILQGIGPYYARDYIRRFGFDPARHPPYLTMALGAGSVTPLQLAAAYGVFANGGFSVKPYLIEKVTDKDGRVLMQAPTQQAGGNTPRVIDARNAWLMTSMMQDVTRYGTAARAGQLGRSDIAGKTGTTNDARDTWFAGYTPDLVAVAWMGYDQPRSLGRRETGAQSALPIWIQFMGQSLKGLPQKGWPMPPGLVTLRIDPATGTRLPESPIGEVLGDMLGVEPPGMVEHFYQEFPPPEASAADWQDEPIAPDAPPGTPI